KMTGRWLCRTGDGNKKLKPSVTPRRIAAVKLPNLKKLFPMLRGEMKRRVNIIPTPSWENKKKNVDDIIVKNRDEPQRHRDTGSKISLQVVDHRFLHSGSEMQKSAIFDLHSFPCSFPFPPSSVSLCLCGSLFQSGVGRRRAMHPVP